MEEKSNMTAERSLEIITEQIERSRQMVAKDTGVTLYVAGMCTMGMAILIGICNFFIVNWGLWLLWITLPIIIYIAERYVKRNKPKVPASFVGKMVDKTWQTFGIFVCFLCVFANLYNYYLCFFENPEVCLSHSIRYFRIILLLYGMAITINGYTLKNHWMVWCGIIGGIGGFMWESLQVTQTIVFHLFSNLESIVIANNLIPCIMVAIFAFIGLTLPGMMLKKQNL